LAPHDIFLVFLKATGLSNSSFLASPKGTWDTHTFGLLENTSSHQALDGQILIHLVMALDILLDELAWLPNTVLLILNSSNDRVWILGVVCGLTEGLDCLGLATRVDLDFPVMVVCLGPAVEGTFLEGQSLSKAEQNLTQNLSSSPLLLDQAGVWLSGMETRIAAFPSSAGSGSAH
jgi:hypothetical protein